MSFSNTSSRILIKEVFRVLNEADGVFVGNAELVEVLTTVFVEDVREAVEDAVAAATVGAALLHPLAVRNQPAAPAHTPHISKLC